MPKLTIAREQAGPVTRTITQGAVDRVGANAACRLYARKLGCKQR